MNDPLDQLEYEQIKEGPFRPRDLLNGDVAFHALVVVGFLAAAGYLGGYATDEVLAGDIRGAALSVALGVLLVYMGLVLLDQLNCRLRESATCRTCRKEDQRYMADGGTRIQYRDYVRAYFNARDVPDTPPDYESNHSRWEGLLGAAIVAGVGTVVAIVFMAAVGALTWATLGYTAALLLALFGAPIGYLAGVYLGGPAADYVLEVPREGVME